MKKHRINPISLSSRYRTIQWSFNLIEIAFEKHACSKTFQSDSGTDEKTFWSEPNQCNKVGRCIILTWALCWCSAWSRWHSQAGITQKHRCPWQGTSEESRAAGGREPVNSGTASHNKRVFLSFTSLIPLPSMLMELHKHHLCTFCTVPTFEIKGTVSRDFLYQVFFNNQLLLVLLETS